MAQKQTAAAVLQRSLKDILVRREIRRKKRELAAIQQVVQGVLDRIVANLATQEEVKLEKVNTNADANRTTGDSDEPTVVKQVEHAKEEKAATAVQSRLRGLYNKYTCIYNSLKSHSGVSRRLQPTQTTPEEATRCQFYPEILSQLENAPTEGPQESD